MNIEHRTRINESTFTIGMENKNLQDGQKIRRDEKNSCRQAKIAAGRGARQSEAGACQGWGGNIQYSTSNIEYPRPDDSVGQATINNKHQFEITNNKYKRNKPAARPDDLLGQAGSSQLEAKHTVANNSKPYAYA